MFGQHRHQAEDQRQLAVVGAGEIEAHGQAVERFGLGDLGVILSMVGPAVIASNTAIYVGVYEFSYVLLRCWRCCWSIVPFWTSFLIRTFAWKIILDGDGSFAGALGLDILFTWKAVLIGPRLRLPAVVRPARLRGAGTHGLDARRRRARPRCDAVEGVPGDHPAAYPAGHAGRARCWCSSRWPASTSSRRSSAAGASCSSAT